MNFKKLTEDLTTSFSRAVQYTEERLGQAERTEYDAHFESLLHTADATQLHTDKLIKCTEAALQPNPAYRMEDFMYEKLERGPRDRTSPLEDLGNTLVAAGGVLGPGTNYGSGLAKVGQTELRLSQLERDFINTSNSVFLKPLRSFLETDMKTINKERKILETKRLDLDAAKSKVRRAKQESALKAAEMELEAAQSDFDRQQEVTKLLLEGVNSSHLQAHHFRSLNDFVEAQMNYHAECHQKLQELQRQLGSSSSPSVGKGEANNSSTDMHMFSID